MQNGILTTPFGRRTMTLGHLARQMDTAEADENVSIDKWKLFRLICEARPLIGVSDRALVVLNALLTFYPDSDLTYPDADLDDKTTLIVFPSNERLSQRAHGMAPATLRRHLAALVDAGLIIRKDSPNGKRFKRNGKYGQETVAYGFNLTPLLARATEFENMALHIRMEKAALKATREELTLVRRDVSKLIEMGIAEGVPADWETMSTQYASIAASIRRVTHLDELKRALSALTKLRDKVHNLLETHLNSENTSGNAAQNDQHIHNSNTNSLYEYEKAFGKRKKEISEQKPEAPKTEVRSFPLGMVLQACRSISIYSPSSRVGSWSELNQAVEVVRPMLGITESAYRDACTTMGTEQASIVVSCILQRQDRISSAGGYLRALTEKALDGKFSVGPMLMALLREDLKPERVGQRVA